MLCCGVLHCAAVCSSVLQCVAVYCSVCLRLLQCKRVNIARKSESVYVCEARE